MEVGQAAAIKDISRPPRQLVDALAAIGSATLASELYHKMGIRDPHIRGPRPLTPRRAAAGPALPRPGLPQRQGLFHEPEYEA
ncbi:ribonuclease activity regulator RraA, partial [Mesorhizobium sp. M0228]